MHAVAFPDDDEDVDVLDPAQLASVYANEQLIHQHQQQPTAQHQSMIPEEHCRQSGLNETPASLPSTASAGAAMQQQLAQQSDWMEALAKQHEMSADHVQAGQQPTAVQQHQGEDSLEEEQLIRMDDPLFATLSERRQKLMALEEILLNTGIEG